MVAKTFAQRKRHAEVSPNQIVPARVCRQRFVQMEFAYIHGMSQNRELESQNGGFS